MEDLYVYRDDRLAAVLSFTQGGKVSMRYAEGSTKPISVSLPNAGTDLDHRIVRSFFDNLLPDNVNVRKQWAVRFSSPHVRVSANNPFALLSHMGQDVAGALRIAPSSEDLDTAAGLTPLSEADISARLAVLSSDSASWSQAEADRMSGRFSLAGAQAKTALTSFDGGSTWYEPTGDFPSTHIIKPSIPDLGAQDLIEHISIRAGHAIGLPMAQSTFVSFGRQTAVMSTRYDRQVGDFLVRRTHQEDLCQALGVPPERKYQSDGGPSASDVARLLRKQCGEGSVETFLRSLAYSWAIEHTDGHAKNYSLLHRDTGETELAPLYDVCSAIPYRHGADSRDPLTGRVYRAHRLAFKIGSTDQVESVGEADWVKQARDCGVDPDWMLGTVRDILDRTVGAVGSAIQETGRDPDNIPALGRLVQALPQHVEALSRRIPEVGPAVPPPSGLGQQHAGRIWVEPHLRSGRPVEGHWRERPAGTR